MIRQHRTFYFFVSRNISPSENLCVSILTYGEGFHNYHHVFPYDYKTAELGDYVFNPTTAFIDFFARIGWAYSRKTILEETIRKRIARTGDGTHRRFGTDSSGKDTNNIISNDHHSCEENVWGWGDRSMTEDDQRCVSVIEKVH
ncbi:Acyl-CoA Delta(11) desaturase [Zootermopsis nevadensis]|uniref:Acyl-CoA Delta(11) desaturase n=1 Tax=Zootermopsis nevadensis TaxID=136037 RepID=A0A067QL22_ZOONE|nr:Acyl-CoA Delta(11) desaturase [Zootermopsis nevadensis]